MPHMAGLVRARRRNWAEVRGHTHEGSMTRKTVPCMVVHAHPAMKRVVTGACFAEQPSRAIRTIVVTCTNGDLGEVKMPGLRLTASGPRGPAAPGHDPPGRIAQAAAILGVTHVYQLGIRFRNGRLASNQERQAFVQGR